LKAVFYSTAVPNRLNMFANKIYYAAIVPPNEIESGVLQHCNTK